MVEYFQDAADEWRFTIKGANGEIVATSEGYTRSADAVRGFNTLKRLINEENDDGRELSDVRGNGGDSESRFDGTAGNPEKADRGASATSGATTGDPVERAGE